MFLRRKQSGFCGAISDRFRTPSNLISVCFIRPINFFDDADRNRDVRRIRRSGYYESSWGESRESVTFWGLSREGVESRSVVRCELRALTNLKLWPEPLFFYTLTDSIL